MENILRFCACLNMFTLEYSSSFASWFVNMKSLWQILHPFECGFRAQFTRINIWILIFLLHIRTLIQNRMENKKNEWNQSYVLDLSKIMRISYFTTIAYFMTQSVSPFAFHSMERNSTIFWWFPQKFIYIDINVIKIQNK